MENFLSFLTSVITAIIGGSFAYLISRLDRTYKKFTASKEALETLIIVDSESRKSFIYTNFEENNFYAQTGIRTNAKNISKFVNLYNKLGISWRIISKAQHRLNLSGEEIGVNLKKYQIKIKEVVLILAFIVFILGFGVTLFTNELIEDKGKSLLFSFTIISTSLVFGYTLVSSIDSINSAHIIQRKLNLLDNLDQEEKEQSTAS